MAQITKIVKGPFYDGVDSTVEGYVAKKIQDVIDAADTVEHLAIFHKGSHLVAVIVYTEPL